MLRRISRFFVPLLLLMMLFSYADAESMPDGFVRLNDFMPEAVYDIRYYTGDNFVGDRVDGYEAPVAILTIQAARAVKQVQTQLAPFGLGLKIFDGFRPQRAVDHFVRWAEDIADTRTKAAHYPGVDKKNLFKEGYIAARSGHSRGSTVDLTIIDLATGQALDMGTPFDYFGPQSWPDNKTMPAPVRGNRALLHNIMVSNGFIPYEAEWWHFTLKDEPYPDTYFDFPVR
jgi:zinc D-Ala-D-Ala dipeptidase